MTNHERPERDWVPNTDWRDFKNRVGMIQRDISYKEGKDAAPAELIEAVAQKVEEETREKRKGVEIGAGDSPYAQITDEDIEAVFKKIVAEKNS